MGDFLEIEVSERENYTQEEVDSWWEKYDIGLNTEVIWVTNLHNCAAMYCDLADPVEVSVRLIIEESDDGDEGYLGVL
jgi:hypothetical protein